MKYPIVEIFTSVQGEGTYAGVPVTFVRTAGCNLSCPWCDTKYSWKNGDMKQPKLMESEEIVEAIKRSQAHYKAAVLMVVITGGEPTIHNLLALVNDLHREKWYVAIETNGTNPVPQEWEIDWVTCSPKPQNNYRINCTCDELKYVVDDNFDPKVIQYNIVKPGHIFLQVESARQESAKKAFGIVMNNLGLRVGLQMHKYLEVL